ncbi:MAG: hypothetical protein NZ523_07880, partial [Elioraea sp.]|nr:hypothetical protein [Elioraea sp.]
AREANRFLEAVQDLAAIPAGGLDALNVAQPAGRLTLSPLRGIFDAPARSAEPAAVRRAVRKAGAKARTTTLKRARTAKSLLTGKPAKMRPGRTTGRTAARRRKG